MQITIITEKVLQLKKCTFLKNGFEVQHFMENSIYFIYNKMPTLWNSEVNKAILEQKEVLE